jgi:hypothetical protein
MQFQEINKKYLNSLEENKIRLKKYTTPERKKILSST